MRADEARNARSDTFRQVDPIVLQPAADESPPPLDVHHFAQASLHTPGQGTERVAVEIDAIQPEFRCVGRERIAQIQLACGRRCSRPCRFFHQWLQDP